MPRGVYERKPKVEATEICAEHWPNGWPEGQAGVSCEHGHWDAPTESEEDGDDGAES